MGQSINDTLPSGAISQTTLSQLEKRFFVSPHPIYTNNPQFKLLHEKLTNKKYILRIITVNDENQKNKLQEKICRKTANKTPYLPKLEHYIFEQHKGYCGTVTKCYLLFEIGEATILREQILRQANHRVPFTEQQLTKGVQNLIYGLLWLRYLKQTHENVNTLNIFCLGNTFMLADPMISPANNENPERYISPEKQQKIENRIDEYDPYVSDIFSIGMCVLEVLRNGHMQKMYKINGKLNTTLLISQIERCKYEKIKDLLKRLLINANNSQNREVFLQSFSKKFNASMVSSQMTQQVSEKAPPVIHQLGRYKRKQSPPARNNNFMTTQDINRSQMIGQPCFNNFDTSQIVFRMDNRAIHQPQNNIHNVNINYHNENRIPNPQRYNQPIFNQQRVPQNPQNVTNYTFYRPQSVGKLIPTLESLTKEQIRREPSYNLPPYEPKKLDLQKMQMSYVTKKLDFNAKEPLSGYGNSTVSNRFSRDPLPAYNSINTSVPYTSSNFWDKMQANLSFEAYKARNQNSYSNLNKPYEYESTSKRQGSLPPKKFSLERKHSEKQHFQKYLDMHDTLKKQNKKDEAEDRQSQTSVKKSQIKNNEIQNVEDVPLVFEDKNPDQQIAKQNKTEKNVQDDIIEEENVSPQKQTYQLHVDNDNKWKKKQVSEMKVIGSTNNPTDFDLPANTEKKAEQSQVKVVVKEDDKSKEADNQQIAQFTVQAPTQLQADKRQQSQKDSPSAKGAELRESSNSSPGFSKIIDQNIQSLEQDISYAIKDTLRRLSTDEKNENKNNPEPTFKVEVINQVGQNLQLQESQIIEYHHQAEQSEKKSISLTPQASQQAEYEQTSSSQQEPSPATPSRPYNPTIKTRFNRTIPQQSQSQAEQQKQQLGQYRQEQYQNGGRYCGFVYNNQRNGEGTFYYKDGGYYVGQWKNNAMNGFGRLYYDNGSLAYEGQWYKDQFHGRGRVYNDSASELVQPFNFETFENYECFWKIYDGDLAHDIKEGHGKLILSNGQYFNGMFEGDVPHGEGYFHTRGQVIHGVWEHGKMTKQL